MLARTGFLMVLAFWVTMNVMLWRAEYGMGREGGSPIPVDTVVRRILTAPDDSSLEIRRHGERIGYCHWVAGTVEELTLQTPPELEGLPEGMIQRPRGYAVRVDGGILAGEHSSRLRFNLELELTPDLEWSEFTLRLGQRPAVWGIWASADAQKVEIRLGEKGDQLVQRFMFEDLQDPAQWIEELAGPFAVALMPWIKTAGDSPEWTLGLDWRARTDWMQIGGTRVRVHRLSARLLDRHRVDVLVNQVGEIMRVDLPDGILLVNDVLVNF